MTIITLGAALTGCAQGPKERDIKDGDHYCGTVNSNAYIVVSENGIDTLHKGNVVVPYHEEFGPYQNMPCVLPTVLKFNCGKELQTSQYVAYPKYCPSEEKYDEVCDCARELTK